ncbi:LOW QUALITY PROTEIN: glucokinase regulatory protein [Hipposideros larvatus]
MVPNKWPVVASRKGTEHSALHRTEELKGLFVAGQMDYCMDNPAAFLPVLVGFNPVSMAWKLPQLKTGVQHSNKAEQMQKLQGKREVFVLNPTIGFLWVSAPQPKSLSSSSRLKGGSTTKILLEPLFLAAHKTVEWGIAASQRCLLEILWTFERVHEVTCSQSPKIEALMKQTSTRGVDGAVMKKPPTGYKCVVTEKAGSNATKGTAKEYKEPLAANQVTVKGRSGNSSARTETQMTQQGFLIHMVKLTSKEWFSGQPKARCRKLLQVIHFPQPLSDDIWAAPISFHIQVAHEKEQVVPVALLSLLFWCAIPEAQAHQAAAPCEAVRNALIGPSEAHADPLETLEPAL